MICGADHTEGWGTAAENGGTVETLQGDGRVEAHVLRGVGQEPRVEIHIWQMGVPKPVLQLSRRQAVELIEQIERVLGYKWTRTT